MALESSSRFAGYEIVRLLGKGGMGEVYLARDSRLEREVALKMLPTQLLADAGRRRRFAREAKLASRLVHPNAAVIYEVGEWNGADFLAMEFVNGDTLKSRLSKGPLRLPELLDIAAQLADVVSAAHQRSIIHRDIKPGNIIITPSGQLKLLDFGLARLDVGEIAEGDSTASHATAPGTVLGTSEYMSPEQALGREADERSDIFSLGVVLYEMATGTRPFHGASYTSTIANILHREPEPIIRLNYEIPVEYERIVRKCLEKLPENRYQSAREIRIDLRNLERGRQSSAPTIVSAPARGSRTARRTLLLAGSAAGVLSAGGLGWWIWGRLPGVRSLAVLPLANSGTPDTAYLSDGLTEALINRFSQVRRLRVLARSAVYNRLVPTNDAVAAGKKLAVDAVLAGRVDPGPNQLTIALELIDTADVRQLWGKTTKIGIDRLALAGTELAQEALDAMGFASESGAAKPVRPVNTEAYQAYLRGRYQLNKRTGDGIQKSIEYFKEAQDHDPAYALPYAGLAAAFVLKTAFDVPKDLFPMAQAAAQRALELDGDLPEAHAALARIRLYYQWDWRGSESATKRALDLNPNYAAVHSNYAMYLLCRKRFDEAIAEVKRAAELDPLSATNAATLGYVYYLSRQFDRAVTQLSKVIETDKNLAIAYFYRGTTYLEQSKFDQAIADFDAGLKLSPDNGAIADQGMAYARAGKHDKAREAIRRIEASAKERYVSPHLLAFPYLGLGETERAIESLEKAAEDRSGWVVFLGVEPKLDPLRSNPRFQHLLKLVGVA